MTLIQTVGALVNRAVLPLMDSTPFGGLVAGRMTVVTYTGPRSGRRFRLPVGYTRDGDQVVIGVELPEQKTWWRSFRGEGHPLTVRLDGVDRPGHGVSHQDAQGKVTVTVRLAPSGD